MPKPKKTEEIKTRVEEQVKADLFHLAVDRGLDLSDIVRQALREFLTKNRPPEPRLAA